MVLHHIYRNDVLSFYNEIKRVINRFRRKGLVICGSGGGPEVMGQFPADLGKVSFGSKEEAVIKLATSQVVSERQNM